MLTAIEGIYDNGQIFLKEKPLNKQRVKVFVMKLFKLLKSIPK